MTTAPITAAVHRPTPPVAAGPWTGRALVVIGHEVPDWAVRWCARHAREVHHRSVCGDPGEPASTERVRAIADIAAGAVRSGNPVLALPSPPLVRSAPARVVAAVRQLPDDALALSDAAACARHMGADLVVAHGLPTSFGERSMGLDTAVRDADRLLAAAVTAAVEHEPGLAVRAWLARVQPHELVGERLDADLLVLGGPRVEGPGSLGLVARSALFHAPCPVLLTPRPPKA